MNHHPEKPFIVLAPGGSGLGPPGQKGFEISQKHFQDLGWTAEIFEASGQPGRNGAFSLRRAATEFEQFLQAKTREGVEHLCIFATCSGGTMAAYCARHNPSIKEILLYETLPKYSVSDIESFELKAVSAGMQLHPRWKQEYIHTVDYAPFFQGRVLLIRGDGQIPPVVTESMTYELQDSFSRANQIESLVVAGATHSATRDHTSVGFDEILSNATFFFSNNSSNTQSIQ